MPSPRPLVLLTDPIHADAAARIGARADVRVAPSNDAAGLLEHAADADVVVVRSPLPEAFFERAPRLRGAIRHGAGVDMIPVGPASRAGVAVANAPGTNQVSVAEYALGQMISLAHRLRRVDATLRAEGWVAARRLSDGAFELAGRTLGLVGVGRIGAELARMAHFGLRMDVIGFRPSARELPDCVRPVALDDVFAQADVVVLACPLTDATRGLVDAARLARMKPGALLVNVSRGAVVDEPALVDALARGHLGGAALDVFAVQPLPPGSPLLAFPNVIVSSHLAGLTTDSMRRMGDSVARQVIELLDAKLPAHFVNHEARDAVLARLAALGPK